jgi:hypothetical protein
MRIKLAIGIIAGLGQILQILNPWVEDRQTDQVPLYVADCEDTANGVGPCVMLDDPTGYQEYWYVPSGKVYPDDAVAVGVCDTEDGSGDRSACVWVPWPMDDRPEGGKIIVFGVQIYS